MSRAATSTLFFTTATAGPPFEASENAPKPAARASPTPSRINTNRRRRPVSLNSISMRGKLLGSIDGVTVGTASAYVTLRTIVQVRKGTDRTPDAVPRGYAQTCEGLAVRLVVMPDFKLEAPFQPTGDQPSAI